MAQCLSRSQTFPQHSLVLFTVRTLVFTVHTLLIITFSLQYLLLLTEVLFTVLFTDSVFTVHYYVNTVQVLFTDYTALDLSFYSIFY
jgi:hypothetical protein